MPMYNISIRMIYTGRKEWKNDQKWRWNLPRADANRSKRDTKMV